jgi:hypothetical protein
MPPSRLLPRVDMVAHAGNAPEPLTVVRVEGARVVVADVAGAERAFVVHRLTGHWVQEGDPYWGLRLVLSDDEAP